MCVYKGLLWSFPAFSGTESDDVVAFLDVLKVIVTYSGVALCSFYFHVDVGFGTPLSRVECFVRHCRFLH